MPVAARSIAVVTRAVDLLRAAGATVAVIQTKIITADEHGAISHELTDRVESRTSELWTIAGNHEDLGRTVLKREHGVFSVEAEDVSLAVTREQPETD